MRRRAGRLLDVMPIGPGTRFLDLGCGEGTACRQASAKGADATGVDDDADALEAARVLGGGRYMDAPLTDLPMDDGAFDFVWSHDALYRCTEPDAALEEAARVLAPGGQFHMVIAYYQENRASHRWPRVEGVPMVLRSEAEWVEAVQDAGFVDVESERLKATRKRRLPWEREAGVLHVWGASPPAEQVL